VSLPVLLTIAVGLAMDAFAVSVSLGSSVRRVNKRHTLSVALWFGGFQGGMPVLGWLAGQSVRSYVVAWDHWVAFGLLTLIGSKMIVDSLLGRGAAGGAEVPGAGRLLVLGLATSVDALAVGVSLAMLRVRIWEPAIVIGIVTGVLSALGIELGEHVLGARLGKYAHLAGGAAVCGIGVKILVEHLV